MIRVGDRITRDEGLHVKLAKSADLGNAAWTVLCSQQCDFPATLFSASGRFAYCDEHAPATAVTDRRAYAPIVACVCGESLDDAPSHGTWTLPDGTACEYRTCAHCKSTRPYAPVDEIEGVAVELRVSCHTLETWPSLFDALEAEPIDTDATLERAGVVLARRYVRIDGSGAWMIEKPVAEVGRPVRK